MVYSQMGWITEHWATYQEELKQYICSEINSKSGTPLG